MSSAEPVTRAETPRDYSAARPFYTLLRKEILRFMSVSSQTLAAPLISAGLYLLIFGVSLGKHISIVPGLSYIQFVVPGLVLMGVINNSFANSSSSLFMSRYLGSIVELLVTPLTPLQFQMAYTLAAMLRGLLVGTVTLLVSLLFTNLPWGFPLHAVAILVTASFMFAQLGILASIYCASFDTLSMYTNFLILPLVYLGGLFYPVSDLPHPWNIVSQFNPLHYLIEGFRNAILGTGGIEFGHAFGVSAELAGVFFIWGHLLIKSGYKLRS
jgi:ABC-2 type transport system permease protein